MTVMATGAHRALSAGPATMSSSEITNIVVGAVIVGVLVARQVRTRPVRENSAARLVLILGVIGVIELFNTIKGRSLGTATVAWVVGSLIVGAGLGGLRALTVKVWRQPDGSAWRKGTVATAALWVVSLAAHLAMEVGIDRLDQDPGAGGVEPVGVPGLDAGCPARSDPLAGS